MLAIIGRRVLLTSVSYLTVRILSSEPVARQARKLRSKIVSKTSKIRNAPPKPQFKTDRNGVKYDHATGEIYEDG